MKTITVTLSDKAERYFNEVAYSLDYGDGKCATQSQVINHCLEELSDFEEKMDDDVTGFLNSRKPKCKDCCDMGWIYDEHGGRRTCPCHLV